MSLLIVLCKLSVVFVKWRKFSSFVVCVLVSNWCLWTCLSVLGKNQRMKGNDLLVVFVSL